MDFLKNYWSTYNGFFIFLEDLQRGCFKDFLEDLQRGCLKEFLEDLKRGFLKIVKGHLKALKSGGDLKDFNINF